MTENTSMINLFKQQKLRELSVDDYALWGHAMAVIKRVVNAIASMRNFKDIFHYGRRYYLPAYQYKVGHLRYVDVYRPYADLKDLAEDFLYGHSMIRWLDQYYPLHYYPLHFRVFIECVEHYRLERINCEQTRFQPRYIDRLNDCIYSIYKDMKTDRNMLEFKRVRDQVSHRKRKVNDYIQKLFGHHSRLVAIRVDFGYREDAEVSYELISEHREKLLRYLRERHYGEAFVGFIWKLEYGLRKSYHLHTMIFLDGSKVQESISHGKLIGQYWIDEITEGEGVSYNCNAHMDKYQHCGLGRVDYHDQRKIENLKQACEYLTKYDESLELLHYGYQAGYDQDRPFEQDDPMIQPIHSELGRVFGTARLPKPRVQLGRPRRK